MMKLLGSSIWLQLSIILVISLRCIRCGTNNSPGETLPEQLEIAISGSGNITCRMNPSKFGRNSKSSSLYFEQEDTKYIVPNENIHILNDTTIVYMLRNATEQDRNYICKIGTKGIGITHVSVGTAPLDVTDFKCRGYDYTDMECNFTKPHNSLKTRYNLSYKAQAANYIQPCDLEFQQNQAICKLTMDKNNYRRNYEFYNFTLKGENEVGVNIQNFWINHYESVIPPKPDNVTITINTNNTVVITWNIKKYSYYATKGLEYEIHLRPEGTEDWRNISGYVIRNNRTEVSLIVKNLPFAYFWYEISVRLRVKKSIHLANDDSYWSAAYINKFQTLSCPPDTAPKTDVGSFYIDSSETKVRLYWNQLPYYMENGPDFKYVIKEIKRDGVKVVLEPLHIDRASATFPWHRGHNYTFIIKSTNADGESPNNSTIFVPSWSKHHERSFSPQWIRNIYDDTNRTSTLSWSPPLNQKHLVDYTVFWCQSKHGLTTNCEGTIFFQHVSKNSTEFTQKQDEVFNLAVSANYRDFNTGMHWTMCLADGTGELIKLEPEITDIKNRSITLQWSTESVCSSLLEGFNLIYCQVKRLAASQIFNKDGKATDCVGEPITLSIPNTAKKYTMKHLKPYSSYKIQMNMFSKQTTGNLSDVQIINTLEDAPSKPYNLRSHNVTSNSVVLTWSQPEHHNGLLRKYHIAYNNEHHTINCETDESRCAPKQMKYKLENLSSYTIYKIYIISHTTAPSDHSNDIIIKTLVGIPSNPRNVKTNEDTPNVLQWTRPEVPSGRVEFYEVSITLWYKDQIQRRHISGIIDANECKLHLPVCIDADYRYTKAVRAVNVVRRDTEIDNYIFATKNVSSDDVADYYVENNDLRCIGTTSSAQKQLSIIKKYQDNHKYVQYKSVWEKGPDINCSDSKLSRMTIVPLLIVVSSLGVMAAFYVARNKYQKMANISVSLPPGLEAMPYSMKDNGDGGDDFRRNKDPFYNNENRRLLSSISHDSGYACHNGEHNNGGLSGISSHSLGKSNGYIGSNHSTEYCTQETLVASDTVSDDSCIVDQTPVVDDAYMVMELLKPSEDTKLTTSAVINNGNGYVQPSFSAISAPKLSAPKLPSSFLPSDNGYIKQIPMSIQSQLLPSENGYIKPNNLLNWPSEKIPQQNPMAPASHDPSTMTSLPISSSGYVAPHLFQKPLIEASDGYTSLEALEKSRKPTQPTMPQTFMNADEGGGALSTNLPPISGYVTQKELSAFGQQHKFN